jgi:hypothetical protein
MLTRKSKDWIAGGEIVYAGGIPLASEVAKAAAAMTRPRRSRQLRHVPTQARTDRRLDRLMDRDSRGLDLKTMFQPHPFHRGAARSTGSTHSRLVFVDQPDYGWRGLALTRGAGKWECIPKAGCRLSHWYGGLGR